MKKSMARFVKPLVLVLALVFLAAGAWAWSSSFQTNDALRGATDDLKSLVLSVDFGEGGPLWTHQVEAEPGEDLFLLLAQLAARDGISFSYQDYGFAGKLITQIGDKKNGAENKYWQYWINGGYATVGASAYQPQNGDVIEWKFLGR